MPLDDAAGQTADQVTVSGISDEADARAEIPYPIPLLDLAANPDGVQLWWSMLYFTFELPAPRSIPSLGHLIPKSRRPSLERYVDSTQDLASSQFLAYKASLSIRLDKVEESEQVNIQVPSNELTRGFLATFRQFYSDEEPASFRAAHNILFQAASQASGRIALESQRILKVWSNSQGQLRRRPLKQMAIDKLKSGTGPRWKTDDLTCEKRISMFMYGDHMHWGRQRDELKQLQADPFEDKWHRYQLLEDVAGLSYIYIGYGEMVRQALTYS